MSSYTKPPNCDDCGEPMAAEWDTSAPREPKRVGWRCRRIHPVGRAVRERIERHRAIESLAGRLPRLEETAKTAGHEHTRRGFAEQAEQARGRIETLKAECSATGCGECQPGPCV